MYKIEKQVKLIGYKNDDDLLELEKLLEYQLIII
jgi:hypothetical protein